MRAIIGTEKSLGAGEEAVIVFVPSHAFAAAKRVRDFRFILHARSHHLKKSRQKYGARLVGKRKRLLGRQRVFSAGRVVSDESSGSLRREPLAHVALRGPGFLGEFGRRHRSGSRHRFIKSKLVANHDERRVHRSSHFAHCSHHKFVQLCLIQRL